MRLSKNSADAIGISRSGRFVARRRGSILLINDCMGISAARTYELTGPDDFALVGDSLWLSRGDQLEVLPLLDHADPVQAPLPFAGGRLVRVARRAGTAAMYGLGDAAYLLQRVGDDIHSQRVDAAFDVVLPIHPRRALIACGGQLAILDFGRPPLTIYNLRNDTPVLASDVLGGRAIAVLVSGAEPAFLVFQSTGALVHRVAVPGLRAAAIAEERMFAIAITDQQCSAYDLRYGRLAASVAGPLDDVEIDAECRFAATLGEDGELTHLPYEELFRGGLVRTDAGAGADAHGAVPAIDVAPPPASPPPVAAPADEPPLIVPRRLAALQPRGERNRLPPADSQRLLDAFLAFIGALAFRGIAEAWNDGRLSFESANTLPFASEAQGLVGTPHPIASAQIEAAQRLLSESAARLRAVKAETAGATSTVAEVAQELGLGPVATRVLLAVAGPALKPRLARLYAILANDPGRPMADESLLRDLLRHDDVPERAVAECLQPGAPLVRYGLIRVRTAAGQPSCFYELTADPAVVARLAGTTALAFDGVSQLYAGTTSLEELLLSRPRLQAFLDAIVSADAGPIRVVVRGRRGSGRRSVLAAIAAIAGRGLAVIDASRLSHESRAGIAQIEAEAERAFISGHLPCVSGVDDMAFEEPSLQLALRAMLRRLPMPLALRMGPTARPPVDAGYVTLDLGTLDGPQRQRMWSRLAGEIGLDARDTQSMASRFRVTPGIAFAAAAQVQAAGRADSVHLAEAIQQGLTSSFGTIASRVDRLATWEQLVLPPEVLDTVREFISRVRNTHRVYDAWGFDRVMSTSRGMVAMFQGSPGTGKTMVAGVIARELGLDLYRVDVSRVVSKWLGETEKNLGAVFDAAEDGQVLLLFDEADSLFSKRTEVRSSNDRYANLEVNYLLQRLDAFQGLAILTTNFGRSVDSAFNRRLTLRLTFPFPDEEMRGRLWRAHLPPEAPIGPDIDFGVLSRKYQLSGGYIRNAALRAAFLAAGEGVMLSQQHLVRAVSMEYNDLGRLAEGAALE